MKKQKIFAALTAVCLSAQAAGLTVFANTEPLAEDPGALVPEGQIPSGEGDSSIESADPVLPDTPEIPEVPAEPGTPQEPVQPEIPEEPETPETPEEPDQPEAPATPEEPDTPQQPVQPEKPAEPETPAAPQAPVTPVTPAPVPEYTPAAPDNPVVPVPSGPYSPLTVLNTFEDARLTIKGLGDFHLLPDFKNDKAWLRSSSPYNTPGLWGQCTWFAWARFYEIYGFDPGFSGNGNQCVDQLLAAHPDKFERSDKPAAGAVFSSDYAHNHVGIVLAYDKEENLMLIQEANFDGVSNPVWNEAIRDWKTSIVTPEIMKSAYGEVVYANPILNEEDPEENHELFRKRAEEMKKTDFKDLEAFSFEKARGAGGTWNGQVLNSFVGTITGPSGKETYYNLPMGGVVNIMRAMGNQDEYWVRGDGCKMLGRYIMVAADLRVHPRGSLVETSLGTGIVCDTGEFALSNPYQIDIAVAW